MVYVLQSSLILKRCYWLVPQFEEDNNFVLCKEAEKANKNIQFNTDLCRFSDNHSPQLTTGLSVVNTATGNLFKKKKNLTSQHVTENTASSRLRKLCSLGVVCTNAIYQYLSLD